MAEDTLHISSTFIRIATESQTQNISPILRELLHFLRLEKAYDDSNYAREIVNLLNEPGIKETIDSDIREHILNILICSTCGILKEKSFGCGCRICDHDVNNITKAIQGSIAADYSIFKEVVSKTQCPACGLAATEDDLKRLIENFEELEENCRKSTLEKELRNSKKFTCFTCKQIRGNLMCPDSHVHPCQHMCKYCICKQYSVNKSRLCVYCKKTLKIDSLMQEKVECSQCSSSVFLLGDKAVEIDPNIFLCPKCAYTMIENGYSLYSNRVIELKEKLEIYFYLFKECAKCKQEKFSLELTHLKCCFNYYCQSCCKSSCPKCKKAFN